MERPEDVAWYLRGVIGDRWRLDYIGRPGMWLDKLTAKDNKVETLVLVECGGLGVAERLRDAGRKARELGVPLKVINGSRAAGDWGASLKAEGGLKPESRKRVPPVRWLDMEEMDAWLERFYPRRKQVFRSGY